MFKVYVKSVNSIFPVAVRAKNQLIPLCQILVSEMSHSVWWYLNGSLILKYCFWEHFLSINSQGHVVTIVFIIV